MFAEMYCEGVPVSTLNTNGSITYGRPLTRQQLLKIALERFDSAITMATGNGDSSDAQSGADRPGPGAAGQQRRGGCRERGRGTRAGELPVRHRRFDQQRGGEQRDMELHGQRAGVQRRGQRGHERVAVLQRERPAGSRRRVPNGLTGTSGSDVGPFIQQHLYQTQSMSDSARHGKLRRGSSWPRISGSGLAARWP